MDFISFVAFQLISIFDYSQNKTYLTVHQSKCTCVETDRKDKCMSHKISRYDMLLQNLDFNLLLILTNDISLFLGLAD